MKTENEEGFLNMNETTVQISEARYNELLRKEQDLRTAHSYFEDVGHFHLKMKLPVEQHFIEGGTVVDAEMADSVMLSMIRTPDDPIDTEMQYRTNFMFEEFKEFIEATAERDILKQADALADLVWVVLGTAHYLGIPFDRVWAEVRRANMEKRPWQEGDPIKPRNVVGLEVIKPAGWRPPDIDEAVFPTVHCNGDE